MLEAWSGTHKSLVEPTTNYWNGNSPYRARQLPRWSGPPLSYRSTEKAVELGAQHHGLLSVQSEMHHEIELFTSDGWLRHSPKSSLRNYLLNTFKHWHKWQVRIQSLSTRQHQVRQMTMFLVVKSNATKFRHNR